MSYTISKIENYLSIKKITTYEYYFLDANVWFDYLAYALTGSKIDPKRKSYLEFFDLVVSIHLLNIQGVKYKPKFVMTSNLLMEILTSYIFRHAKKLYYKRKLNLDPGQITQSNKDYRRNISTDYSIQLKRVVKRILDYSEYIDFWNEKEEDFGEKSVKNILTQFSSLNHCDFNDFYYQYMCKRRKNVAIVTNDGDFAFKGVEVITNNHYLRSLT